MGGLIVLSYLAERGNNFDGAIASAPALSPGFDVPEIKNKAAEYLGKVPFLNQVAVTNEIRT